ncbi:6213_t:CDS:2 [Acaulospora morrowiae]|uniref:6213_t:CDS:1 n=1 Tax=Acaulospora morrowiae TaxID=94023 RepID=A0A9N9FXB6_9GLOM|nr:6213_t:CDS:2 [Acaulospora morrowiae]
MTSSKNIFLNNPLRHPLCIAILFTLILRVDSAFVPSPRYSVSSILVDKRLFFFGGQAKDSDGTESCQNSVYYLDISTSFDTDNIPWTDLTKTAGIPERICWQVSGGGVNNSIVYLFGGITQNNLTKEVISDTLVFAFDTKTQQWTKPSISDTPPERRRELSVAQDNSGKIFIFGGLTDPLTGSRSTTWFSDMSVLDISRLTWLFVVTSGIDIPPPQADFTATMLSNGTILYIGGRQSDSASGTNITYKRMDQIWTYDTSRGYWRLITTVGTIPGVRAGHSAVLAPNGRVIVYGGVSDDLLTPASPDLAVLDTSTSPFQWSTPNASGTPPPVLAYHSTTLIENFMIVAFGNKTQGTSRGASSDIYILDTTSYAWVTTFKSISPTKTSYDTVQSNSITQPSSSNTTYSKFIPINTALILGVTIGAVISVLTLCIISFFLFRHWRKYKKRFGDKLPFSDSITPPADIQMPDLHEGRGRW